MTTQFKILDKLIMEFLPSIFNLHGLFGHCIVLKQESRFIFEHNAAENSNLSLSRKNLLCVKLCVFHFIA